MRKIEEAYESPGGAVYIRYESGKVVVIPAHVMEKYAIAVNGGKDIWDDIIEKPRIKLTGRRFVDGGL